MRAVSPPPNESRVDSAPRFYSMRRLSPYQGTVQIVDMPGFSAMSADGVSWEVRIGNPGMRPTRAVWREESLHGVAVTERIEPFVEVLRHHPPLPFTLADTLELWLLDAREMLPLALLASALPHMAPPNTVDTHWRAAFSGDDCFVSSTVQATAARPVEHPFIPHPEILNRCVRKAASARPRAQWFRREVTGDGVGAGGHGIEPELVGRQIEAVWFPELLAREEWDSDLEQGLVRDYHDWLAPALLTHSNIRRATRERLERAACAQAEKLYRVRHLLPQVINSDLVEVALVEAMLRRTANPPPA
jgi:hypothetical protein